MSEVIAICPKCGGEIDALVATQWGIGPKPGDRPRCAPYLCGWCASLLLMVFEPAPLKLVEMTPDMITAIKGNHVLWKAIEHNQKNILKMPNRRPVRTQ